MEPMGMEKEFLLKEKYNGVKSAEYEDDVQSLESGVPLAYLIGFVPFLGTKIFLDSHPLIPRTETEYWVEKVIHEIKNKIPPPYILDIFAGSGCIGVALMAHLPTAHVDFAEIEKKHLSTIVKNLEENNLSLSRATIFESNVWSAVQGRYDYILANPPYLAREHIERVENSVLTHEPANALFAKENGFALIRETIAGAPMHLHPQGMLYIEHEPEHAELIKEYSQQKGFLVENHKDQYGTLRYSTLKYEA